MKRVIGVAAAIVAVGVASAALAQSANVVPGQGLGGFRLGEDLDTIISTLGPLNTESDLPGGTVRRYFWPLSRIEVFVNRKTKKVTGLVALYDETYVTEKGVAAGSEMTAVRTAYGPEETVDSTEDDETLIYDKLGVAFVVDKTGALGGHVSAIFVFLKGHYRDLFKPPAP